MTYIPINLVGDYIISYVAIIVKIAALEFYQIVAQS